LDQKAGNNKKTQKNKPQYQAQNQEVGEEGKDSPQKKKK